MNAKIVWRRFGLPTSAVFPRCKGFDRAITGGMLCDTTVLLMLPSSTEDSIDQDIIGVFIAVNHSAPQTRQPTHIHPSQTMHTHHLPNSLNAPAPPPPSYNYKPAEHPQAHTYEDIKLSAPLLGFDDVEKGVGAPEKQKGRLRTLLGVTGRLIAGIVAMVLFMLLIYWVATRVWEGGKGDE